MAKVKAVQSISYAAAVKWVEGLNEEPEEFMMVDRPTLQAAEVAFHQQDPNILKVLNLRWTLWPLLLWYLMALPRWR